MDEGFLSIADAVLEGVLDEGDEHEWGYLLVGQGGRHVDGDAYLVGIAQFHQRDIVLQEGHLTVEGHTLLVALVEHEAHHLRQFEDGGLRLFWVDVYQGVDIVEGVHEEVGIDLVFQIFQLLFQILLLQVVHFLLVAALLEVELDAEVHAAHEDEDDEGDDVMLAHDQRGALPVCSRTIEVAVLEVRGRGGLRSSSIIMSGL